MLEQKNKIYNQIYFKILHSKKIALISHINPDLDTVGSRVAFFEIIKNNFVSKKVDLICKDKIPLKYNFLDNVNLYKTDFDPNNYDLIIFFDSGSQTQTGFLDDFPSLFDKKTYNTLCIDHHITNERYGRQNIINTTFARTTMIVFEISLILGLKLSKNALNCILAGIYSDTGGLKHSNTDSKVLFAVSKLVSIGASISLIVDNFFKNNKLSILRLWGNILKNSFIDNENVINGYVNKSILDSYGCGYEDISGVIDYLNMVYGVKYSRLLTQKGDYIKGSLRTLRDDVDLTIEAQKYNGGGHKKASGFTTKGIIKKENKFKIVNFF